MCLCFYARLFVSMCVFVCVCMCVYVCFCECFDTIVLQEGMVQEEGQLQRAHNFKVSFCSFFSFFFPIDNLNLSNVCDAMYVCMYVVCLHVCLYVCMDGCA